MPLTEKRKKEIGPEYCVEGLKSILRRFLLDLDAKEAASIYGAISLILDKPISEWLFGEKKEPGD